MSSPNVSFAAATITSLRRLDSNQNGVSVSELKQLDGDKDGSISAAEAGSAGIAAVDVKRINDSLRSHASEPNLVLFGSKFMAANEAGLQMKAVFARIDGRLDGSQDGYLSKSELNDALHSTAFTGQDAAAVATLYEKIGDLEEFSNDEAYDFDEDCGVTLADIEGYVAAAAGSDETATGISASYEWSSSRISAARGSAVAGNRVDPAGIRPEHVEQGMVGDCVFLAALASLAGSPGGPDRIKGMIKAQSDGSYDVSFPGQAAIKVRLSDAELGTYASGAKGLWVPIMEKAFAQLRYNESWVGDENIYAHINGMTPDVAISALTGHATNIDALSFSSFETLRSRLSETLGAGRLVTAGIRMSMPLTESKLSNGLPMEHAYTVIAYDPATDQITLRNPWGYAEPANAAGQAADGKDDGIFTLSLSDFNSYFTTISFEEAN